ncbi:Cna B-type domain-containing protein [Lancefieldella rimae]|uniref:Cna B-type domain-containing protein n=1 Tax=Lancefieldella rimae TaxID=1383 RepID=UPI001CB5F1A5|nr:Cna B-type domain-containing protein [Lancefieldella rimae]MBF4804396.1 Cna B-type domain-containing protein [Lancefieldella rimae]
MKKKFCSFLSLVLALSLMIPGGALNAFADDAAPSASKVATEQSSQSGSEAKEQKEEHSQVSIEDNQSVSSESVQSEAGSEEQANAARTRPLSKMDARMEEISTDNSIASDQILSVSLLRAPSTPKQLDVTLTDFKILDADGNPVTELAIGAKFKLKMNWKLKPSEIVHTGDYFDLTIPNTINLSTASTPKTFDITDSNGNVVAKATVTSDTVNGGGKIHVVFNDKANNHNNYKGTIELVTYFNQRKVTVNTDKPITIDVNGKIVTTNIHIKPNATVKEIVAKWGEKTATPGVVKWNIRINQEGRNLQNVKITDTLKTNNGEYIPSTTGTQKFTLIEVEYNSDGSFKKWGAEQDLTGKLTVSADKKSFEINLGNIGTKQYFLMYYSTMTSGTVQTNAARLTANGVDKTVNVNYHDLTGGSGHADGDLASKIKLIKVDEDGTTPLKDAVFTVTKPDGSTFELTTGADGSVVSNVLPQGNYKVKEKTAPKGYELGTDEYTLQVTPTGGAIQTITNKPIKTSVPVTKIWVGPKAGPITVHLLADGTDTGKTLTLNEAGNWKGSFDGLRKYKTDGTEIVYTVKEDDVANYTNAITGDIASGFTITNTNTEKVDVPVKKEWVGPKAGPVTVHLLADGVDTGKTVILSDANSWTDTFSGLDKYKADGTAIVYTVKEDDVANYTNAITSDATTGFTITNTNTEKVSVSGTKTWNDNNNQDGKRPVSITVNLLKNGTKVDSKTVTPDVSGAWTYSFSGLDKYNADGTEITYTVSEDPVDGYTSTVTGTNITNSYTPETIVVKVTKAWVGPKTNSVTVHLLADGTDTGKTIALDEAANWTGTFSNLPKYKDGTAITYTVKEDDITNYTSTTTGDTTTGFMITNTNTEKVNVPVKKEWIGPKAGPVTVHLLADGTDTGKTLTLDEAGSWKGSFDGLKKYNDDGTEIVYTVKEDDVPNYTGAITGDATTGFTITNTNTEKVDVSVTKKWVGPKAGPVTVHLLADGTDTGKTVTLSDSNSWTDTFSGLDKYNADGTKIVYTVKEDEVSGYTSEVTGDATTGFTITNTEVPHDTPKPKEDTPKKSNRKPAKKSGKAVPYTGDSNATGIAIALASAAVVLIGGGVYLRRRDQRE